MPLGFQGRTLPSESCLSVMKPGGKPAVHSVVLKTDYGKRRLLLMLEEEVVERKWRVGGRKIENGCGNSAVWLLALVSLGSINVSALLD